MSSEKVTFWWPFEEMLEQQHLNGKERFWDRPQGFQVRSGHTGLFWEVCVHGGLAGLEGPPVGLL